MLISQRAGILASLLTSWISLVEGQATLPKLLLMTKTSAGAFRHDSIPVAVDVISRLANGSLALTDGAVDPSLANSLPKFNVTHTENDAPWEDEAFLSQFAAVAFVLTNDSDPPNSTSILSSKAGDSLGRYIEAGGGIIGIHSATATLYGLPLYGRAMGAFFNYHNVRQPIDIGAVTRDHLSTSRFPQTLTIDEEYYHFHTDPRQLPSPAIVLLTNTTRLSNESAGSAVHNATASNGPAPQPLAWYRSGGLLDAPAEDDALGLGLSEIPSLFDASVPGGKTYSGGPGRMFHTSLGHANDTWMNPGFQGHILGGIMYVLQNGSTTAPTSVTSGSTMSGAVQSSGTTLSGRANRLRLWNLVGVLAVLTSLW